MKEIPTSSLAVLGTFTLRVGDHDVTNLPRKAQALTAFLAMQPGRRVPREAVADLLWTQSGPEQARHSLRQMLLVLRRTPAGGLIKSSSDALWIESGILEVDALTLEAALAETDDEVLSNCFSRYRGALLDDLPAISPAFDEWLRPERARLAGITAQALHRLVAARTAAGDAGAAVEMASRLVDLDILDEAAHRTLIECLARAGRRVEALRQFETCAHIMHVELDIALDAETVALADRIRTGTWPLKSPTQPATFDYAPAGIETGPTPATDTKQAPKGAPSGAPPKSARKSWRGLAWAAAVLGIVGGSACVFALRQPALHPTGLLVANFRNVSGIPNQRIAIAGFGDLVKVELATQQHLRLIETGAGSVRNSGSPYLLDGSAAFETSAFHVTARLTDVRHEKELWSNRYDVPVSEVPSIADDIAVHAKRALSQDREIVADPASSMYSGGPRVAQELMSLGHQIDYFPSGADAPSQQIYRLALRFDADNADLLAHLANTYIKASQSAGAIDQVALVEADGILRHALQLDPTNVFGLFNTCVLRRLQWRISEAMELCKRTLDIDPKYPGALRELGHDLMRAGDAPQAIASYKASIDSAPYQPYTYNAFKGLGVASLAVGRREDAITYLRKSIELDLSGIDDARLWLAAVLEMNDRHEEAAKSFAEFMDRHPGLEVNDDYLQLLHAPAYADCRAQVLAALASAGRRQ